MIELINNCAINQGIKHLCKYVSADTACTILTNRTAKWSSPLLFNDPFDMQTRLRFDFTDEDLVRHLANEIIRLAYKGNNVVSQNTFRDIIRDIRNNYGSDPSDINRSKLLIKFQQILPQLNKNREKINKWWRNFTRDVRIFCVAEEHDNLLMWAHYSKSHTGAVIKFKLIPELNTDLCVALSIHYVSEPPTLATMEEYIEDLTGQKPLNTDNANLYLLSKSDHWQYEKEWRCVKRSAGTNRRKRFDFFPILPDEIDTIYLGCKMKNKKRNDIIRCLTTDFSHVEVYQAKKSTTKFELVFERIR